MKNKLSKIDIVMTVIVLLVACFVMITTFNKRVQKGTGDITTKNYTDFMQVSCSQVSGNRVGNRVHYTYFITVTAKPYYKLENVTISYSFDGIDLPDNAIIVTVEAGEEHKEKCVSEVSVPMSGNPYEIPTTPTFKITVKFVTGTYIYSV